MASGDWEHEAIASGDWECEASGDWECEASGDWECEAIVPDRLQLFPGCLS